ncbi:MAG: YggU family protein [Magnetococcales bacterium]|nr:YggU family protein [Magnetococcales bacterium]
MTGFGQWQGDNWLLAVRVQPRSSQAKIIGMHGDSVKIALTSPPVDGAANKALCQLIAKEFGIAKGRVAIVRGHKAREKQVRVAGVDAEVVGEFCKRHSLDG